MEFTLTVEEQGILLKTARVVIGCRLEGARYEGQQTATPSLKRLCGAFVTLRADGHLRGCIGHVLATRSLIETVEEVAVAAAFQDPRFPPLGDDEFGGIEIEISVLSPLRRITDISEIEVGAHGILIRQGHRSGLLLPQVATEQHWDRERFLANTCRKAGLAQNCWKSRECEIEIFSAIVFGEE